MECEKCSGKGYMLSGGEYKKCSCLVQKELDLFLKQYRQYHGDKKYCRDDFIRDMLFVNMSESMFGGIAKSILAYLFLHDSSITWDDFTGMDLINVNFDRDETYVNKDVYKLDFAILRIGRDTKNCILGDVLTNCISRRREQGNITWVYQYPNTSVTKLRELYGADFIQFLKQPEFKALQGG